MNKGLFSTIFACFLLSSSAGFAQINEIIQSDRPGQAFTPLTVGDNVLQLQGGVGFYSSEQSIINVQDIYQNLVIRYGIKERIEFNAAINHTTKKVTYNEMPFQMKASGLNQFAVGFRINLFKLPSGFSGSWETRGKLNFLAADAFSGDNDLGFISSVSLGYPLGISSFVVTASTTDVEPFKYVVNYSINLSDSFFTFVEIYGTYNEEFYNAIDAGVGYQLNKDFQVDIYGGIDLDEAIDSFFIESGVSYRFLGL